MKMKKLISKLTGGGSSDKAFAEVDKLRAARAAWTAQYSTFANRVNELETAVTTARVAFQENPTDETFERFIAAQEKARTHRAAWSAVGSFINNYRLDTITATPEARETIKAALVATHKSLSKKADEVDEQERRQASELGIEHKGSALAASLRAKANRLADAIGQCDGRPPERCCWDLVQLLDSI